MKDRYTMIFPNYTIGVEAYEKIREVCPRYGKSVVVIGGRKGIEAAQEKMVRAERVSAWNSQASSMRVARAPTRISSALARIRPCRRRT